VTPISSTHRRVGAAAQLCTLSKGRCVISAGSSVGHEMPPRTYQYRLTEQSTSLIKAIRRQAKTSLRILRDQCHAPCFGCCCCCTRARLQRAICVVVDNDALHSRRFKCFFFIHLTNACRRLKSHSAPGATSPAAMCVIQLHAAGRRTHNK
jgi:hypothetical protein